jgi:predicted  nucleic acid-binding Zn-ribbon protein
MEKAATYRVAWVPDRERELRRRVAEAEQALAWAEKDLEDFLALQQEIADLERKTKEAARV